MSTKKIRGRKQPKPADPKSWKPHDNESWLFVSNAIDTYGLNVYEFRVLAHVARRAGGSKGICNASQKTIADCCGINQRKVMQALKVLCAAQILSKKSTGRANEYKLNLSKAWKAPSELENLRREISTNK